MQNSNSAFDLTDWFLLPWQLAAQAVQTLADRELVPGTLTQAINPWNTVVNINSNNSSAPETERTILAKHSYGRQLGRLTDVVALMLKHVDLEQPLSPKEQGSVAAFHELESDIERTKKAGAERRVSKILADVKTLQNTDAVAFQKLLEGLRELQG